MEHEIVTLEELHSLTPELLPSRETLMVLNLPSGGPGGGGGNGGSANGGTGGGGGGGG